MSETVIRVENIAKRFGENVIFEQCSVSIEKGQVFGLVGLNGSGKTTFIRMLLGLLKPASGSISVLGFEPFAHDPELFTRLGVILDHDGFAGNLTVADNLTIFAGAKGMAQRKVSDYIEEYWNNTFLYDEYFHAKKKVKYLSRGQKMQCAICRAFLSWPDAYLLDEPTVALDVDAIDHFYSLVNQARSRGGTVLISSHQLSAIEDLCSTVGMLHNKTVTIVPSPGNNGGPFAWMVRGDGGEQFGKIIESVAGFSPQYRDDAWHFEINDPQNDIPEIVRSLASYGCRIREVRAEGASLKDRIQTSRAVGSA